MAIEHKVRLVEELFDRLEKEIAIFQSETHLHCIAGCGKCCSTPEIEASPLEFLPWAFQENYNTAEEAISKGLYVPVFTDYYMQLSQIDNRLATTLLPINQALATAIEEVLHYYAYRPLPNGLGNSA